jgi:hypothetical protein
MILAGHVFDILAMRLLGRVKLCEKYQPKLREQKRLEAVTQTLQAAYDLGVQHAQTQAAPEGAAVVTDASRC